MKTRRAIITVEVETILPITILKKLVKMVFWGKRFNEELLTTPNALGKITQVQVNVVKPEK